MTTKTATEAHEAIQQAAKQASPEIRTMVAAVTGRQGDVYLRPYKGRKSLTYAFARVTLETKRADYTEEIDVRQLAPGTSQGSRHIADETIRVYRNPSERSPLIGPVIVVQGGGMVRHPEHAHFALADGEYQCSFQDDLMQEEIARVLD